MKKLFLIFALFGCLMASAAVNPRQEGLKAIAKAKVTPRERQALEWLYRYMPIPDITGHSPEFFIENVRATFAAADSLGWNVPEREFRHFVLPVRINNEELDNARQAFFAELLPRIKGMTMEQAILEVNHWCHEKVTYRPSDPRTTTPLVTVSNAVGRCGEESTFAVAALRSVGIPARQVYTPRWAHTDDNHAWVEAWADGKWYFLGACEPEPVLNLGWFNEPASRGMLMNTKVFGAYDGPEEVVSTTPLTTEINVTANYAPTGTVTGRVVRPDGSVVEGAPVRFCLYNYAEFFPLANKVSDANGEASLVCGQGDLIVWATDGTRYGMAKGNPLTAPRVDVVLDMALGTDSVIEMTLTPPPVRATIPPLTPEQISLNNRRKAAEDSIRAAYTATFITEPQARALAAELGVDADAMATIMGRARGHHKVLADALRSLTPAQRRLAVPMLLSLNEKDPSDVSPDVILDAVTVHARGAEKLDSAVFVSYVLCPRVEWEPLSASKQPIHDAFNAKDRARFVANPAEWVKWVADNIAIVPEENPHGFAMHPEAVLACRKADGRSRRNFFVAGARAFGIPARFDMVTGKTQYLAPAGWVDVDFAAAAPEPAAKLPQTPFSLTSAQPLKYYLHYTLGKIVNGIPQSLDFDDFENLETVNAAIPTLDPGEYILTSGQRMADGSVLLRTELFEVKGSDPITHEIIQRHDPSAIEVIGNFNSENLYVPLGGGEPQTILSTTGRGFYVLGIIGANDEPSAHTLNDIASAAAELEAIGRPILLLFADKDAAERFDPSLFPKMPSVVSWGYAPDATIINEIVADQRLGSANVPLFIVADTFNRIVDCRQGYTIGSGDRLASLLRRL